MKKTFAAVAAILIGLAALQAATVTLTWDASPASENVTTYKVSSRAVGGDVWMNSTNTTNTTFTATVSIPTQYKIEAINFVGTGAPVILTTPTNAPAAVSNATITVTP